MTTLWNSIVETVGSVAVSAGGSNAKAFDAVVAVLVSIKHPSADALNYERGMVLTKAGSVEVNAKRTKSGEAKTSSGTAVRKGISKLILSDDKAENKAEISRLLKAWDIGAALNWAVNGDGESVIGSIEN